MKVEKVEEAVDRALSSNLYCAESVLLAFAEGLGMKSELVPRIASGFCSGLSLTGGTCGAVNGGIMALGLIFGRDSADEPPYGSYAKVQEFLERFKDAYGSCNCTELTGCDLSTEEGRNQYMQKELWRQCQGYVKNAVSVIAEIATDKA
jgi:C_GCAxxG_C_C family probable redox protein